MSSSLHLPLQWSLLIYRVRDDARQQEILAAFRRMANPGMTVLGTQDETDHFVIVDCETTWLEREARFTIFRIDPGAMRVLRSRLPAAAG